MSNLVVVLHTDAYECFGDGAAMLMLMLMLKSADDTSNLVVVLHC